MLFYWNDKIKNAQQKLAAMSQDVSPRVRVEAIAALSHFPSEATVNALLAVTGLPVDYYISYDLSESFKQLKPVWMAMFKKDDTFLAKDTAKANYLLAPLYSQKLLAELYYTKDDPQWRIYDWEPLSKEELASLSNVPAVTAFLARQEVPVVDDERVKAATKKGNAVIYLATLPAKMRFDKESFTVKTAENVTLVFDNHDDMAHNVVIATPGSNEIVGKAADAMSALKNGYEKNFVPDLPQVLYATPLISAGKRFILNFKAPAKPGNYPFICSFPGHWQIMKGVMKVNKPS